MFNNDQFLISDLQVQPKLMVSKIYLKSLEFLFILIDVITVVNFFFFVVCSTARSNTAGKLITKST